MSEPPTHLVTQLLAAVGQGAPGARDRLWELIYQELRAMAAAQLRHEGRNRGLQTTSLVHKAYLRLMGDGGAGFENRRYFFGAAARAMRRILVDDARNRRRLKRGGPGLTGQRPGPEGDSADCAAADPPAAARVCRVNEEPMVFDQDPVETLAVDDLLERLEAEHPRLAEVAHLRYFVGLTVDETAGLMGVSSRTVDNDWRLARSWLRRRLAEGE